MKIAWFHKPSTSKNPSETVTERLDRLEAGLRALLLEWEDTYERVHRALARLNKRTRDAAEREAREPQETPQDDPQTTIPGLEGMDPISAAIHRRRARVSSRPNGSG